MKTSIFTFYFDFLFLRVEREGTKNDLYRVLLILLAALTLISMSSGRLDCSVCQCCCICYCCHVYASDTLCAYYINRVGCWTLLLTWHSLFVLLCYTTVRYLSIYWKPCTKYITRMNYQYYIQFTPVVQFFLGTCTSY